jgi:hypothetical protein
LTIPAPRVVVEVQHGEASVHRRFACPADGLGGVTRDARSRDGAAAVQFERTAARADIVGGPGGDPHVVPADDAVPHHNAGVSGIHAGVEGERLSDRIVRAHGVSLDLGVADCHRRVVVRVDAAGVRVHVDEGLAGLVGERGQRPRHSAAPTSRTRTSQSERPSAAAAHCSSGGRPVPRSSRWRRRPPGLSAASTERAAMRSTRSARFPLLVYRGPLLHLLLGVPAGRLPGRRGQARRRGLDLRCFAIGSAPGSPLTTQLAQALADPEVDLRYQVPGLGWVDEVGRPVPDPGTGPKVTRASAPGGGEVALISGDRVSADPRLVKAAASAAALALDAARLDAETRVRWRYAPRGAGSSASGTQNAAHPPTLARSDLRGALAELAERSPVHTTVESKATSRRCPSLSRRQSGSSARRRSRTWPGTRRHRTPRSSWDPETKASTSRSVTTASAGNAHSGPARSRGPRRCPRRPSDARQPAGRTDRRDGQAAAPWRYPLKPGPRRRRLAR